MQINGRYTRLTWLILHAGWKEVEYRSFNLTQPQDGYSFRTTRCHARISLFPYPDLESAAWSPSLSWKIRRNHLSNDSARQRNR